MTAQSLSVVSPSSPAHLLGLTLPGAPDPPFFLPWLSTATSPESPGSGTSCPWLTFFLCLSQRRLPVSTCPCFYILYCFWFWTHSHSGSRQIVAKKSPIISLINSFKKYVLATCCSDEVLNMVMRKIEVFSIPVVVTSYWER